MACFVPQRAGETLKFGDHTHIHTHITNSLGSDAANDDEVCVCAYDR